MTSRITDFQPPHHFADEQVRGPFAGFRHDHAFTPLDEGETLMVDEFVFDAPFGPLGALANRFFLTTYMRRLLRQRNAYLKQIAEESHVALSS